MNKDVIEVNGKKYYSTKLAALLTPDILDANFLLDCLRHKSPHFSLNSYRLTNDGEMQRIPEHEWRSVTNKQPSGINFPDNTYVKLEDLRNVYVDLFDPSIRTDEYAHEFIELPSGELLAEDLVNRRSSKPRNNSRASKEGRLKQAMEVVIERARQQGMELNTSSLPGVKRQMLEILVSLDPHLEMEVSTFDTYADDLGWRWKQGTKEQGGHELLNIFIPNI